MSFDFYYGSKYQYSSKFKHYEVIAKQIATGSKLQEGYNLAMKGQNKNAIKAWRKAKELQPNVILGKYSIFESDENDANKLAEKLNLNTAKQKITEGYNLAIKGKRIM